MRKIVFLDIDGVVLPVGALSDTDVTEIFKDPWGHLDLIVSKVPPSTVSNLKALAEQAKARFVLISSWRKFFANEFNRTFLKRIGLFEHFHKKWAADFRFSSHKNHDIADWLGGRRKVRTTDCLVIDDDNLWLEEICQIRPVAKAGFTEAELKAALEIFGVSSQTCQGSHP